MTSKEKAKELVEKLYNELWNAHKEIWSAVHYDIAKQCALICVDEILSIDGNYLISTDYWKEVKQEIEKR